MRKFGLWGISMVVAIALAACGGASSSSDPAANTSGGNTATVGTTVPKATTGAASSGGGASKVITGDAAKGKTLFTNGANGAPACTTCHYVDKAKGVLVGPNQYDIGTRAEVRFKEPGYKGKATNASDYLKESICNPNVYITEGFQPNVMYQNFCKDLTDSQVNDLVAYLLTLKG